MGKHTVTARPDRGLGIYTRKRLLVPFLSAFANSASAIPNAGMSPASRSRSKCTDAGNASTSRAGIRLDRMLCGGAEESISGQELAETELHPLHEMPSFAAHRLE